MIIGNAMVAAGMLLNRLESETKSNRAEIIKILSLGGTPKQSIVEFLKQAITSISLGFLSFSTLFNENDQFIIGSN